MKKIYAIRDRIAQDLAGMFPLVVFNTDAQAVRYFGDSMKTNNSSIGAHPNDYELIILGSLHDDGIIEAQPPAIIVTGTALIAATIPDTEDNH